MIDRLLGLKGLRAMFSFNRRLEARNLKKCTAPSKQLDRTQYTSKNYTQKKNKNQKPKPKPPKPTKPVQIP